MGICVTVWVDTGNSPGKVPDAGRTALNPQSAPSSIRSMPIFSTSPGIAPSIATGPVSRCACPGRLAARMRRSSGATVIPEPSAGRTSSRPEKVWIVTLSPGAMVRTGGNSDQKRPQWTVSGVAAR